MQESLDHQKKFENIISSSNESTLENTALAQKDRTTTESYSPYKTKNLVLKHGGIVLGRMKESGYGSTEDWVNWVSSAVTRLSINEPLDKGAMFDEIAEYTRNPKIFLANIQKSQAEADTELKEKQRFEKVVSSRQLNSYDEVIDVISKQKNCSLIIQLSQKGESNA
jgi:hypothetical protein